MFLSHTWCKNQEDINHEEIKRDFNLYELPTNSTKKLYKEFKKQQHIQVDNKPLAEHKFSKLGNINILITVY